MVDYYLSWLKDEWRASMHLRQFGWPWQTLIVEFDTWLDIVAEEGIEFMWAYDDGGQP